MDSLVMVIDDSLTVRKILEASLQRAGLGVSTFADGLEAMHALTHHTTPVPQLVLLDVGLPKVNGYTVARTLRHHPGFAHPPFSCSPAIPVGWINCVRGLPARRAI